MQALLEQPSSPKLLSFSIFSAAISGGRPVQLTTNSSSDWLGTVIEQDQSDGTTLLVGFWSRSTLLNKKNWSAAELKFAAIVWAVKKKRQLFYGITFIVVSDHEPLENLEGLATNDNRVQGWFDLLSAYNYKLVYRLGRLNRNADLTSRLPLPATEEKNCAYLRLTDPSDVDVHFLPGMCQWGTISMEETERYQPGWVGVSNRGTNLDGLESRTEGKGISLGELESRTEGRGMSLSGMGCRTDENVKVREKTIEQRIAPRTTDKQAKLLWQQMQCDRNESITRRDNPRVRECMQCVTTNR